jgi:hypothetical protein
MRNKGITWRSAKNEIIWNELIKRTVKWIYEARPTVRVVVMTEPEVVEWAKSKGIA